MRTASQALIVVHRRMLKIRNKPLTGGVPRDLCLQREHACTSPLSFDRLRFSEALPRSG